MGYGGKGACGLDLTCGLALCHSSGLPTEQVEFDTSEVNHTATKGTSSHFSTVSAYSAVAASTTKHVN